MIVGDAKRATISCDWPGCRASVEMAQIEGKAPAVDDVGRIVETYYGWQEVEMGGRVWNVCSEHPGVGE